ncbi:MAG: hypothetical protein K8R59_01220 [Thermoanaerobaculales bacterium]|nr:hypothetical protein [Thermoanaerobaculales bacterium]
MIRLLVVDRSELLAWMVAKVATPGVKIERAETFVEAERVLAEDPPDGAIFNLVPCHTKWRLLIDRCVDNGRAIPFLCTAVLEHYDACGCELPCRGEDFIPRTMPPHEFSKRITLLMEECRKNSPERFRVGRAQLPVSVEEEDSLPVLQT